MQLETQLCRTWGSTSLAPHHAALSSDGYIHQGTGLVNLKITRRGQIPPACEAVSSRSYADWHHGGASLPSPAWPVLALRPCSP